MSKAIIFDIDGTAIPIGKDDLPSVRLQQAIGRLQPQFHISTASGRSLRHAEYIIDFLALNDPCIIAAGTEIYDPVQKKIVWRVPIPTGTYAHIENALKENQDKAFSGDFHETKYVGSSVANLLDGQTAVVYVIAVDAQEAAELTDKLQHPELTIINMHSFYDNTKRDLHIHSVNASKEHAVAELLKMLDVKKDASTVIGDGLNDLHFFAGGGTKIAMGNAVPELKAAADLVIKSIDEDGLALYLESLAA